MELLRVPVEASVEVLVKEVHLFWFRHPRVRELTEQVMQCRCP